MNKSIKHSTILLLLVLAGCLGDGQRKTGDSPPRPLSEACQYPATLEITSINIGQGSATLVAAPGGLMLVDAGESYWNSHADALAIDAAVTAKYGCRDLDTVVITHLDVDHVGYVNYGGLWYLVNVLDYSVGQTLLRDYRANVGTTSGTYTNWAAYLDTAEGQAALNPATAAPGQTIDLGGGIRVTVATVDTRTASCPDGWGSTPDLACGGDYVWPSEVLGDHRSSSPQPSENDYSLGVVISLGDFDMFIGGDLSGTTESSYGTKTHDVESYAAGDVGEVDVLQVSHHGSDGSSNATFVATLGAQAAVISVGNANSYGHARQVAVDRLLGVVVGQPTNDTWLYMTERGDDGLGGCLTDYADSDKAAAELYGRATIASDTDGDYCTIEGGDVDIVVAADGASFTIEDTVYTSRTGTLPACDNDGTCETGEDCASCPADCTEGCGPECGDGLCESGEDCASCPADCTEGCGPECGDGLCETGEDCNTCGSDCVKGSGPLCGNGVCETGNGESCLTCAADCMGRQDGVLKKQYCCGDGAGANPVDCTDPRCTIEGVTCTADPVAASCCGDGLCEGLEDGWVCEIDCGAPPFCGDASCDAGEDACTCAADCGTPPAAEVPGATCSDGLDNDCDGQSDCGDADCDADPGCAPAPCNLDGVCDPGEDCMTCSADCAGLSTGKPSGRFCCGDGTVQDPEGDGSICSGNY